MARIAGIDLPKNKRGIIGLTYVFGVGPTSAKKILAHVSIDENTKVNQWTDEQIAQINKVVAD
jgi:small subunit ribosomal protein S13